MILYSVLYVREMALKIALGLKTDRDASCSPCGRQISKVVQVARFIQPVSFRFDSRVLRMLDV